MFVALAVANLIAAVWLLIVVYRQHIRKHLPWFVSYATWQLIQALVQPIAALISRHLFVSVYWWMEGIALLLTVAAVRESFLRIFMGFTKMPWFRWTVTAVIAAVVAYSAWKAIYHPPVQGNWLTVFVVGAEFLFRWGIAAIAALTFVLSWALDEPRGTWEDTIISGFGILSVAFLSAAASFSLFGDRFLFFNKYAPSVGYFLAVFIWIWFLSRPVEGPTFEDLGIGPEDMLKLIRRYREDLRRIRGQR